MPISLSQAPSLLSLHQWKFDLFILFFIDSTDKMMNSSSGFPTGYSPAEEELLKEIAATELEISFLEKHLLSLYRTVFSSYIADVGLGRHQRRHSALPVLQRQEDDPLRAGLASSKPISRRRCRISDSPVKLSEDTIRCISSVNADLADAPASLASSSSTSGSVFLCDGSDSPSSNTFQWTPRRSKSKKTPLGPYSGMLEVPKLSADGPRFASAAAKLKNYSALIRRLEMTDPRELTDDEKLAFWVNIHNALVMHAFLAYGLGHSSAFSKASYDVGGLKLNAYDIRTSILRCQSHIGTQPKLGGLFPSRSHKSTRVTAKHPYAVDQPDPLVHFALCGGAYSDPAVRLYTAGNVRRELEVARDEFLLSNVRFEREKKRVILPKLLVHYAAEADLDQSAVLVMVRGAMRNSWQKAALRSCTVDYAPLS